MLVLVSSSRTTDRSDQGVFLGPFSSALSAAFSFVRQVFPVKLAHATSGLGKADRKNLKDSVCRIKRGRRGKLYHAGNSMICLDHPRALLDNPPGAVPARVTAFCVSAGARDQGVLPFVKVIPRASLKPGETVNTMASLRIRLRLAPIRPCE
jgi:hypothetical protein